MADLFGLIGTETASQSALFALITATGALFLAAGIANAVPDRRQASAARMETKLMDFIVIVREDPGRPLRCSLWMIPCPERPA